MVVLATAAVANVTTRPGRALVPWQRALTCPGRLLVSLMSRGRSGVQFEIRLQSAVGEFYQRCNGLLPDCRLVLANSNQVEFD